MDLVQQRTYGRQATHTRPQYIVGALFASAVIIVVIVAGLLIAAMTTSQARTGGLGSPEWRQFRASEHSSALQGDPFLQQWVVEFRRSERAESR